MKVGKCAKNGKLRYRSELDAKLALLDCSGRRASSRREEKAVYQCPFCRGWHLTSKR